MLWKRHKLWLFQPCIWQKNWLDFWVKVYLFIRHDTYTYIHFCVNDSFLQHINYYLKTIKGVPDVRGPALVCLSAIDKKSVYWSSSWARILNVQDIIKGRTKERSSNISSACISSTTIAGAGQYSFNTCLRCATYRWCRPTLQIPVQCLAIIAAHCWFNAGQSSTTLAQHYSVVYFAQARGIQPMLFQCWPTVSDAGPSLKQQWVITPCFLTAALCWWRLNIPAQETPDTTIHWPNADVMLGHRLRRWANLIPTKTL